MSVRMVRFLRKHPHGVTLACYLWIIAWSLVATKPWRWGVIGWVIIGPMYALVIYMFFLLWKMQRLLDPQRTSQEHE